MKTSVIILLCMAVQTAWTAPPVELIGRLKVQLEANGGECAAALISYVEGSASQLGKGQVDGIVLASMADQRDLYATYSHQGVADRVRDNFIFLQQSDHAKHQVMKRLVPYIQAVSDDNSLAICMLRGDCKTAVGGASHHLVRDLSFKFGTFHGEFETTENMDVVDVPDIDPVIQPRLPNFIVVTPPEIDRSLLEVAKYVTIELYHESTHDHDYEFVSRWVTAARWLWNNEHQTDALFMDENCVRFDRDTRPLDRVEVDLGFLFLFLESRAYDVMVYVDKVLEQQAAQGRSQVPQPGLLGSGQSVGFDAIVRGGVGALPPVGFGRVSRGRGRAEQPNRGPPGGRRRKTEKKEPTFGQRMRQMGYDQIAALGNVSAIVLRGGAGDFKKKVTPQNIFEFGHSIGRQMRETIEQYNRLNGSGG